MLNLTNSIARAHTHAVYKAACNPHIISIHFIKISDGGFNSCSNNINSVWITLSESRFLDAESIRKIKKNKQKPTIKDYSA